MLQFFKDASLTNAVTVDSPVWILAPEKGGKRRFSLWLGDNYRTLVAVQAAAGATSITVVDTSGMPTSGQFYYRDGAGLITYTGKTATTLTGSMSVHQTKTYTYVRPVLALLGGTGAPCGFVEYLGNGCFRRAENLRVKAVTLR